MNYYTFDLYKLNEGIEVTPNNLIDYRVCEMMEYSKDFNYTIVKYIINNNNINDLIKDKKYNVSDIKYCLQTLYELDILTFKRPFTNKIIYESNIITLYWKAIIKYIVRLLPVSLLFLGSLLIINKNFYNVINFFLLFFTLISIHELGHLVSFYVINNRKINCYVRINRFNFELCTKNLGRIDKIIISIFGPLSAIIIGLIYYILTNDIRILYCLVWHLSMLLPFFEDGKHIWFKQ